MRHRHSYGHGRPRNEVEVRPGEWVPARQDDARGWVPAETPPENVRTAEFRPEDAEGGE